MALSGMSFVITGEFKLPRKELEQKIKNAGGGVSARLSKKVTHCLCGNGFENTNKYSQAKSNNLNVVSEGFVDACIRNHAAGAELPTEAAYSPSSVVKAGIKHKNDNDEDVSKEENKDEESIHEEDGNEKHKDEEDKDEEDKDEEDKNEKDKDEKDKDEEDKDEEDKDENKAKKKDKKSKIEENKETIDSSTQESPTKSRSPRKKKAVPELISSALSGWTIVLDGRLSKPHSEIAEFLMSHGGKVSTNISSKGATNVTHLLVNHSKQVEESQKVEAAKDAGVTIIDEEYLEWFVEDANSKKSGSPQKAKKSRRIEKIISKRILRGEPQYLVSYVGLGPEANEYISKDEVEKKLSEKQIKHFERDWKKSMKDWFNPDTFFLQRNHEKQTKANLMIKMRRMKKRAATKRKPRKPLKKLLEKSVGVMRRR